MTVPLIILAILTTIGGLMNMPFLTGNISEDHHGHPEGVWLALEAWLEHSISSFEYAAEGIVNLPKTPVVISPMVAGLSSLLAIIGLALAGVGIYRMHQQGTLSERLKPRWGDLSVGILIAGVALESVAIALIGVFPVYPALVALLVVAGLVRIAEEVGKARERIAVQGDREHVAAVVENVLRAVAVVDVDVHDGHSSQRSSPD